MAKVRADVMEATDKRQLPWGHTNLIGTVYLNPMGAPPAGSTDAQNAPAPTGPLEARCHPPSRQTQV